MSSSPDPLGLSNNENAILPSSPQKGRRALSITPRKPLINVSGNSTVQEFYVSTPTPTKKHQLSSVDGGRGPSPWHIRVTLQAESTDDGRSKIVGLPKEQTTITKIPLKGGDDEDSSFIDADRGRRKSLGSPTTKRHGTPKPKSNHRRRSIINADFARVEDESIIVSPREEMSPFAKPGDAFPKRRRVKRKSQSRSPNKLEGSQAMPEQPPMMAALVSKNENELAEKGTTRKRSKSRKRRIEISPMKPIGDLEDSGADNSTAFLGLSKHHDVQMQLLNTDDEAGLNENSEVDKDAEEKLIFDTPSSLAHSTVYKADMMGNPEAPQSDGVALPLKTASSLSALTLSETDAIAREEAPDPTNEHHDFDTILESEGFSMVSVDSLSSTGQLSRSPMELNGGIELDVPTTSREVVVPNGPSQEESVHGYSDISSFIPSAASPTKTSHLPAPQKRARPPSSPSITRSAHRCPDTSSMRAQNPVRDRVSQLRQKPKAPGGGSSPSISRSICKYPDNPSTPSDEPSYLEGTRQVVLRNTPTDISSPSIPAAPVAIQNSASSRPLNDSSSGTPKLDRTKRAGSALQCLQSPKERMIQYNDRLGSPFQVYNKPSSSVMAENSSAKREDSIQAVSKSSLVENSNKLFDGFGTSNRRELKAGLRLGEELAKRHDQAASSSFVRQEGEFSRAKKDKATDYPKTASSSPPKREILHSEVIYPKLPPNQLPSPAESDLDEEECHMSSKVGTPVQANKPALSQSPPSCNKETSPAPEATIFGSTIMAREAEWQREREAVSRRIQMANASEVIVIDSDSESDSFLQNQELEDKIDSFAGSISEPGSPKIKAEPQLEASDISLQPEVGKVQTSKLPSPWKSNSQIDNADQAPNDSESDLFWQPDHTKAAKRRQQRKRLTKLDSIEASILDEDSSSASREIQTVNATTQQASTLKEAGESVQIQNVDSKLANSGDLKSVVNTEVTDSSRECESYSEGESIEEYDETLNGHQNDDSAGNTLKSGERRQIRKSAPASLNQTPDLLNGWSSQGLAFIDPMLLPVRNGNDNGNTQTIATQTSIISSSAPGSVSTTVTNPASQTAKAKAAAATAAAPLPSTTWFSSLSSLFTQTAPPIPWYNSPTCGLSPATRSDILASSPNVALSPTTPWTKAHQAALIPLYQSSWLFGAHIFAYSTSSASARYVYSRTFQTPLGWHRKITRQDSSVVDAFMTILAARSKRFDPTTTHPNHHLSSSLAIGEQHQYNLPAGTPIDETLVLRKCLEIWQDMVMSGDVDVTPAQAQTQAQIESGDEAVVIGLRRKGDKVWDKSSWWDVETGRSQRAYFDRKRRDWGGLPSWRKKGLV